MALSPGTTLGSYEVSGLLGKGGMGEVYRARDSRLGREVAIKTLPAEFASDSERLARLEREARALASFNHPNIAGIHGLEEAGGTRFLVLELVEGDTLADQIKGRHLFVEQALRLALQIASALEAAHAKGIIHRDLKPGNIKVTPDGTVKVLDFGLAKVFDSQAPDLDLSNSPTLSMAATARGVIMGTAGYMSPQQARGEPVDRQADIWAFGCVLFELLSWQQTWSGRTATDVMAALIAREPEWSRLPFDPTSTPPGRSRTLPGEGAGGPLPRHFRGPHRDRQGAGRSRRHDSGSRRPGAEAHQYFRRGSRGSRGGSRWHGRSRCGGVVSAAGGRASHCPLRHRCPPAADADGPGLS